MAATYTPIQAYSATGSQTTITFSSFSGYTDLVLVVAGNSVNSSMVMQFNGDTAANYSRTVLRGNGTSATSFLQSAQNHISIDGSYSQPAQNAIIQIMNYSNSTTYKTTLQRSNNAGAGLDQGVGLWRNTAAITSIALTLQSSNYTAGTTFTLYGIKAA